jgi:23S rRNA (cytidine1920-2'-O)/16S rRNA (cytidine1409-2'-O)-methyltransferase
MSSVREAIVPIYKKKRLDVLLVEKNLAPTRSRAADLVRLGAVSVGGVKAVKPGMLIASDAGIEVASEALPYVSRGALKLEAALEAFGFEAKGSVALDLGASTGGFTEVLLARGAEKVYAVDVGTGQLHAKLGGHPRVVSLEGTDARAVDSALVGDEIGAIVADLSFISLAKALPAALRLAAPGAWLIALVKPQFEIGRAGVGKGGIVHDPAHRREALAGVRRFIAQTPGWSVTHEMVSPILGKDGNEEFLIGAVHA